MLLTYATTGSLALAFVMQLAVDHAPEIVDDKDSKSARRVLIVGLALMLVVFVDACIEGIPANPVMAFGLFLVGLAEVGFSVNQLFPGLVYQITSQDPPERRARR